MQTSLTPNEVLRRAVAEVGSQSAMGRLLGVTQAAVWGWISKGKALPGEHVLAVEKATNISRHDLRPDLYPRESEQSPAAAATGDRA